MESIRLFIDSVYEKNDDDKGYILSVIDNDDNKYISISFSSYQDYLNFFNNPQISIDNIDSYDLTNYHDYLANVLISFNPQNKEYLDMIKNTYVEIKIEKEEDIDYDIFKSDTKVIADISSLPLDVKMKFLNSMDFKDNILFIDKYTYGEEVSYKDLLQAYSEMRSMCEEIKNSNLKEREYIKANEDESIAVSRSLVEVLKRKEIVCAGFTNIFLAISDLLGLAVEEVLWSPVSGNNGHSSVIVYLNDPKYSIKGIYGIDTTWDANNGKNKRHNGTISHFLMPFLLDKNEKEARKLISPRNTTYASLIDSYERFNKLKSILAPNTILNRELNLFTTKLNCINNYLGLPQISETTNPKEEIDKISCYERRLINPDKIKQIIMTVDSNKSEEEVDNLLLTNPNYIIKKRQEENTANLLRALGIKN